MRILLGLGSLAAVISCGAFAAEPDTRETFDQVIVTAARSPLDISAVGNAVTIIDREDIERRQARFVTELIRSVPGFAVSQSGAAGAQTQVRVRGAEANHVLVLIDGVRANDPASGDEFRWEYLTTADIERIEIVRGPQSALWGSDAVAAVVHIITRSGDTTPSLGGYLEGGSDNTQNGALSARFAGDEWSLALNAEHLSTDGINSARTGSEKDGADVDTAALSLRLSPATGISIDAGLRHVSAYTEFDAVDFFGTGLPADSDVATDVRQTVAHAGLTVGDDGRRLRQHLRAHYSDSDNRDFVDGDPSGNTESSRSGFGYQADIRFGNNLLALALEHERTEFQQRGEFIFGDPNQDQSMDVTSAVADFHGHAGASVTWLLSARFDDNSDFEDAATGRLSLAWALSDRTRLRASIGSGRKNPTFIERFGFFPGQFLGNPDLKPEQSTAFEAGLDFPLGDDLEMQVTVFRQNLEDEIDGFVFDPDTFLATAKNLDQKSSRQGVEVAATWTPSQRLQLGASYTYTDASEQDAAGLDTRELRRPPHAGSIHANLLLPGERTGITLAADYGGTREDIFFPPFPASPEIVTLESYWLVDLTARHALTHSTTLFARGANLLDAAYEQVYGYQTPGRSLFAGVEVRFGE